MKIEINNQEVEVTQLKDKDGNLKFYEDKPVNFYQFKAFSNPNKKNKGYKNWEYYEHIMKTDEFLYDIKRDDIINSLFYFITGYSSWDFSGASSDMWGVLSVKNYITGDVIRVEFDQYDHGMLVAFLIIRELCPEDY